MAHPLIPAIALLVIWLPLLAQIARLRRLCSVLGSLCESGECGRDMPPLAILRRLERSDGKSYGRRKAGLHLGKMQTPYRPG